MHKEQNQTLSSRPSYLVGRTDILILSQIKVKLQLFKCDEEVPRVTKVGNSPGEGVRVTPECISEA